ncbi:MAG: hypothetical protein HOE86_10110, partial [Gemmatimonadetes bacterium]|nr:hypothetical protein [Gemmatimonadota bacterium]
MCRCLTHLSLLAALCTTAATAQEDPPALNVEFVGEIQLNRPAGRTEVPPTSDMYISGDYGYIGTLAVGAHELYIVDVSNPEEMTLVATVPIVGTAHDVKVAGDIAVVSGHPTGTGLGGITVIDVSNPREPEILSRLTEPCGDGVHNAFLHADRAYLAHASCPGLTIVDLTDPSSPVISGTWKNETAGFSNIIHDIFIRDDIAYLSDIPQGAGGLVIADVSDPDQLTTLSAMRVPEGTHSAAAENGYVYYNAEFNPDSFMRVADARDPAHPVEIGSFRSEDFVTGSFLGSHNPWVEDGLLYWAHYDSGLRIFDLHDPANPVEIGYYATGNTWGVQPYRDGIVIISESTLSGLRAVRFTPPTHAIRELRVGSNSFVKGRDQKREVQIVARTEPFLGGGAGSLPEISLSSPDLPDLPPLQLTLADEGQFVGSLQIPADIAIGRHDLRAVLEDQHGHIYPATTSFTVYPEEDLIVTSEGLDSRWEQTWISSAEVNYEATDEVFSGETSVGIDALGFNLRWSATEPVPAAAYKSLRFAIHPGNTDPGRRPALSVYLNVATSTVRIVGDEIPLIDLEKAEWQEVEIPLSDFFAGGDFDIEDVRFIGT